MDHFDLVRTAQPEHDWEHFYKLKQGNIYVECGAFWGRYALIASPKIGPSGKAILIEASPDNAATIAKVIKEYKLTNATLIEEAVSDHQHQTSFIVEGNPSGNRIDEGGIEFDGSQRKMVSKAKNYKSVVLMADSLDNMLAGIDHVDLLAADIENNEPAMLRGCTRLFKERRIKNVAIAIYHSKQEEIECIEILKKAGFVSIQIDGGILYGRLPTQ